MRTEPILHAPHIIAFNVPSTIIAIYLNNSELSISSKEIAAQSL